MTLGLDMIGLPPDELDEGVLPPEDLEEVLFEGMIAGVGMVRLNVVVLLLGWGVAVCDVGR